MNILKATDKVSIAAAAKVEGLIELLLDQPWHQKCEIITDYMPPYPSNNTRPPLQVRYDNGTEYKPFLRYSQGPKQGFFWDIYGEDFQTVELAIVALSKAPAPVSFAPITFRIPLPPREAK